MDNNGTNLRLLSTTRIVGHNKFKDGSTGEGSVGEIGFMPETTIEEDPVDVGVVGTLIMDNDPEHSRGWILLGWIIREAVRDEGNVRTIDEGSAEIPFWSAGIRRIDSESIHEEPRRELTGVVVPRETGGSGPEEMAVDEDPI